MRRVLLPVVIFLLACGGLRADGPDAATLQRLLNQLGNANDSEALAAEVALLRFGPDLLPLLPRDNKHARLRTVVALLEELKARPVTLPAGTPLTDALAQIEKQTGMAVRDGRTKKSDIKTTRALDQAPFWTAVDQIAADAGAGISHYAVDGAVRLVDRPSLAPLLNHQHAFRTTVKRVTLRRDFDTGHHACVISLETAWEPRLLPLLVESGPAVVVFDNGAKPIKHVQSEGGTNAVQGRSAIDFDVRVPAPPRAVPAIGELKGHLVFTVPTRMVDFSFAKLDASKPVVESREGVQMTVKGPDIQADRWMFTVTIDNPPGTPRFESYQSWTVHNRIALENGKRRWEASTIDELEIKRTARQAVIEYHFLLKDNPLPKAALATWTLHYRTPGRMVEVEVPYRFAKVPLP